VRLTLIEKRWTDKRWTDKRWTDRHGREELLS
jgi:hypothetical protein